MKREERDLSRLLVEVSRHYRDRGFERPAISVLRSTIASNTKGGRFAIHNSLQNFECAIVDLLRHFKPHSAPASDEALRAADAIFAFSCGYQLENLDDPAPQKRQPGKNNTKLAKIATSLIEKYRKPLFVQFEIAAAQEFPNIQKFDSTKEDLGTKDVISQFVATARSHQMKMDSVIVVAHGHHIERCIRLLDKYFPDVKGLRPAEADYFEYDPNECQPRAMGTEEYIVSDFVSMAAMTQDVLPSQTARCNQ
jgi:hypothetical protein